MIWQALGMIFFSFVLADNPALACQKQDMAGSSEFSLYPEKSKAKYLKKGQYFITDLTRKYYLHTQGYCLREKSLMSETNLQDSMISKMIPEQYIIIFRDSLNSGLAQTWTSSGPQ